MRVSSSMSRSSRTMLRSLTAPARRPAPPARGRRGGRRPTAARRRTAAGPGRRAASASWAAGAIARRASRNPTAARRPRRRTVASVPPSLLFVLGLRAFLRDDRVDVAAGVLVEVDDALAARRAPQLDDARLPHVQLDVAVTLEHGEAEVALVQPVRRARDVVALRRLAILLLALVGRRLRRMRDQPDVAAVPARERAAFAQHVADVLDLGPRAALVLKLV